MAIDLPPQRVGSADVLVLPKQPALLSALAASASPRALVSVDSFARVQRVALADDGLPHLEDKEPVAGAAAWVAASKFIKASAAQIMDQLEKRVVAMAASGKRPVVIFDLDSTLFNNGTRQAVIAHEFASAFANDPVIGSEAKKLAGFQAANTTFSNDAMVRSCGVDTSTELGQKVFKAYDEFWRARFFDNGYVKHDTAYANAAAQVQRIYKATEKFPENLRVHVVYLTGRHKAFTTQDPKEKPFEAGMEQGTRETIVRDGLPLDPSRVTLMMKDNFFEKDADFKGRVKAQVNALGEVVGAFDNEPGNVAVFVRDYPRCMPVLVYTIASEKLAQPVRNAFKFGGGANDLAYWPKLKR